MLQDNVHSGDIFMTRKASHSKNGYGIKELLLSLGISVLAITVSSLIMSLIAYNGENPIVKTDLYALFSLVIGGISFGLISGRIFGIGKTVLASLMLTLIMLIAGIIISGSMVTLGAFMNYGCFIATAFAGAYLSKKREKKGHRKHRRI